MSEREERRSRERRQRGIFQRPKASGVWWVRYHDENGREHREKVGPKALALKVYQKRKNEIAERRFFPERIRRREVLLKDAVAAFLRDHVEGRLRNAKHYRRYGELWTRALGTRALRQILPGDIARYIAQRQQDGMAPATVNRELAFLKRLYNVAIGDELAESNPVKAVRLFKENNARVRFLTEDEENALRNVIGETHWPLVAVALHTGLRRSEQFNLRWRDVDFANGVLTIPRSKHGEVRRVPMNETVRDILAVLPSRMRSPFVFASASAESALDSQNFVNRVFVKALRGARIEDFTWHCLRHTFASRLVMAGVDLRTVQELLGHKTMAMTLRYAHLSPGHQLDAVRRLDTERTGTTTGTGRPGERRAARGGAELVDLPREGSGGGLDRTADLGIMSRFDGSAPANDKSEDS